MSFLARLAADVTSVEAGATTPLSVELVNRSDVSDQFELVIEGLDPEWTAVPVPVVSVDAREAQEEKIFFKPPRVSESPAGNYPFVVKVRSLTTGESKSVQGVLAVKPYNHLSIELDPKKGMVSPIRRHNTFEATIVNLGNTEHTVQLFGSDPEDAVAFEFEQEQVVLGPGQQRTVAVTVEPKSRSYVSGGRLVGFSVSARSIEQPSVVAIAQAQLEQRPLMSLGSIAAVVVVACVIALWIYLIPKPPSLVLAVDQSDISPGQQIVVSWRASGEPTEIHIAAQDATIYDGADGAGSRTFTPTFPGGPPASGNFEIDGYVEKDGKRVEQHVLITVKQPPKVDDPKIESFKLDQTNLKLGQAVTISYKVSNAVKLVLLPLDQELDPTVDQVQITVNNLLTKSYTLKAYNSVGKTDSKTIRVTVTQASKAKVIAFTATPSKLDAPSGDVTLNWQATNSVRTELTVGGETRQVDPSGSTVITLDKTTTVTLTAYDDAGVTDKQTLTITAAPPPPPPDTGPPPTVGDSTGSGATGAGDGTTGRQ